MKRITDLTKRDIIDSITMGFRWWGKMEETSFLNRLYDLSKMRSTDGRFKDATGDIWQHRVNNDDWENDWVFYDGRFNLKNGEDEPLLKFLAEMFHPVVRDDQSNWESMLQTINELLQPDGYRIEPVNKLSGRDIYGYRDLTKSNAVKIEIAKVKEKFDSAYISKQIELLYNNIESHPYDSIGKAKELIETCCFEILTALGIDFSKFKDDMTKLVTHTLDELNLRASKVEDTKKGATEIKKILGSLNQIAVGIAELRNAYGSGHGKNKDFSGLTPRHARLAVGSAANLVNFLWETYEIQMYKGKDEK